jgi:hypothetical protein
MPRGFADQQAAVEYRNDGAGRREKLRTGDARPSGEAEGQSKSGSEKLQHQIAACTF